MIYPKSIKAGDNIGVVAPSSGIVDELKIKRLDSAITNFNKRGYNIIESNNVRTDINGQSDIAGNRAKQFMDMYLNDNISCIIAACGGDFLIEMLPYINFEKISRSNPKWIQGFSDITGIIFPITTICDIATIYSENFGVYGMNQWHKSLENSLKILEGKDIIQNSFDMYQDGFGDLENNITFEYNLSKKTKWINLNGEDIIDIQGRLIGGCLDVLTTLVGTKYDNVSNYIEKYKDDKILWYLESCELTGEQIIRGLFQLKEAGWFKYASGFVFGRYGSYTSSNGIDYYDTIKRSLNKLNLPIIVDVDIGHKPPQLAIINGVKAKIVCKNSKGILYYI